MTRKRGSDVKPPCPRCHSLDIIKDGKHKRQQRFYCKQCGRSFDEPREKRKMTT